MKELMPQAEKIAAILKARNETITVAESSTGGLVSAALLAVAGASAYYKGGSVVYTRDALKKAAGDHRRAHQGAPLVRSYTQLRAQLVREHLGSTWGIAEAGTAGPTAAATAGRPATPSSPCTVPSIA
jgi:PncC family amidohydrolase